MFIEGLKQGTAVKIGDRYVVQLVTGGYNNNNFEVNGVSVGNKNQVVVNDLGSIVKVIRTPRQISHYIDEDGKSFSTEYVSSVMNKYFDDDYEERVYPNVDVQIEHIKEMDAIKNLSPVYSEPTEEREKFDVEVVGTLENTGSEFIQTSIEYGKSAWQGGGIYKVDLYSVACNEVRKFKEAGYNIDFPSHGGIEFVKADGNYVFTKSDKPYIKGVCPRICTTLKEAQCLEKSVRSFVSSRLTMFLSDKKVSDRTAYELYKKLGHVKRNVTDMKLMKSSPGSKMAILKTINELMDMVAED